MDKPEQNSEAKEGSNTQKPKYKHPATTHEGRIERAVAVLNAPGGLVADKILFLKSKGLDDTEILEALNIASNGELLRAAGID